MRATQLLASLGTIEQPADGGATYLCESAAFPLLRAGICGSVDIMRSKALDFDDGAKCDALSMAVSFKAFPIVPGNVIYQSPTTNPCLAGPSGQPPDAGGAQPYSCD